MEVRGVVVSVICMEERGKVRMTDRWEGAARLELQRSHHGGVEPSITTHRPQFRIWSLSYDSTSRLCSLELTVLLCWTGRRGPACCRYKPSRWTASAKSFAVSADICQLARRLKAHRLASINWWSGLDDAEVVIFVGPVTAYAYSFNFFLLLVL
ncbi:uncharacterized protein [Aegilops tauschii subsp. strangulata]|uniref:uncharacterized protein isoform X2 n=1 Tax=Aegilops tauschii subsp. strangulata TaxID=200361 RepID=UPI00098A7176